MKYRLFLSSIPITLKKLIRGFLFIPTIAALCGVAVAVGAVYLDRMFSLELLLNTITFLNIDAEGARSVLSTIAGAMMTVISLVYSMTLVVFTLAAGNIGPRLLETFTDNRVNQTTIGLIGATFLYALIVLYIVGNEEVPKISVAIAILLSAVSYFWLIYFLHDVAQRIMVDNEIGRTQRSLRKLIDRILADEPEQKPHDRDSIPKSPPTPVTARKPGYVTAVDTAALLDLACEGEGFIEVLSSSGTFVIEGMPLAHIYDGARNLDHDWIRQAISLADARAPEGDIQFNVHLNVEIGLRALSPGINDAYTAISAIDHLSASLARILQRGAPSSLIRDKEGVPRVWFEVIEMKHIVGAALHPLRRAARGNMLVSLRLIEAIERMCSVVLPTHAHVLHKHLRLLVTDSNQAVVNRDDRREIALAARRAKRVLQSH